ncbi:unnamed protein product [Symbiodinium microadriaticum]|nr:unnamed protein product [Symbiodinium microadriaticum]
MATLYSRPEWKLPKNVQHTEPQRLQIGDICIASATVDLSTLAAGFPYIEGWYHLLDDNQRCIGQIKLTVFQKGSVVVPSDFYDYVDSALELSDGIAEMTESRQDTATVDEEVHGHKREDEGMSMTLLLRDLMAGLEDSTYALIGRGGGAANRTHFPLDETPDDLNVTNSSAGSEAESGDVEGRETDSSGDEKLLLLWGDDEYCEGGIDANVVGDEKYDNSEHDLSRIYDDYKRSSPVGYGDGSLEGSTRWTDDNTDITDGHRGEQDDLEEDDNMDDQENGWIEDSTGIKDAMSVRSSVTAEYNVHVNQSKNDALNGVSSDSEDYLNDPFEAYDADEGSDLPIIEYPSYCDTDRRNDEGDGDRSGSPVLEKGGEHCDLSVIVSDGLMSVKSLTEDNEEDEEEELNMGNSVDEVDEDDNEDGGRNVAQDSTLSLLSLSAESPEVSMDMEMVPHANVIDDYPTEVESPEESDPSVKFVYEEGTLTISQTLAEAHVNEERERSHLREAVETFDIFESISKMVLRENDGRINQPEKTLPLEDSCNLRTEMKTISDIVKSVMSDRSGSNGAPWTANPGKRRRFVDAETDRISKAMLSSINSYGRSTY